MFANESVNNVPTTQQSLDMLPVTKASHTTLSSLCVVHTSASAPSPINTGARATPSRLPPTSRTLHPPICARVRALAPICSTTARSGALITATPPVWLLRSRALAHAASAMALLPVPVPVATSMSPPEATCGKSSRCQLWGRCPWTAERNAETSGAVPIHPSTRVGGGCGDGREPKMDDVAARAASSSGVWCVEMDLEGVIL